MQILQTCTCPIVRDRAKLRDHIFIIIQGSVSIKAEIGTPSGRLSQTSHSADPDP